MTDERLCAYGDWAGHPDRDAQAARIVRELVREVRRLRKELQASALDCLALEGQTWEQPAPVPPFRGILDGITAADVYGVHV